MFILAIFICMSELATPMRFKKSKYHKDKQEFIYTIAMILTVLGVMAFLFMLLVMYVYRTF